MHRLRDTIEKVKYTKHQTAALSSVPLMHPDLTLDQLQFYIWSETCLRYDDRTLLGMIIFSLQN